MADPKRGGGGGREAIEGYLSLVLNGPNGSVLVYKGERSLLSPSKYL